MSRSIRELLRQSALQPQTPLRLLQIVGNAKKIMSSMQKGRLIVA